LSVIAAMFAALCSHMFSVKSCHCQIIGVDVYGFFVLYMQVLAIKLSTDCCFWLLVCFRSTREMLWILVFLTFWISVLAFWCSSYGHQSWFFGGSDYYYSYIWVFEWPVIFCV